MSEPTRRISNLHPGSGDIIPAAMQIDSPLEIKLSVIIFSPIPRVNTKIQRAFARRGGPTTLGDLVARTEKQLGNIRGFGEKTVNVVKNALWDQFGLTLKESAPPKSTPGAFTSAP